jgi:hypothetical protein
METFAPRAMVGLKEPGCRSDLLLLHGRSVVIIINDPFAASQRVTENPRVELYDDGLKSSC